MTQPDPLKKAHGARPNAEVESSAAAVFAANPALADDAVALVNAAGEGHEAFVRLMLRYQPDLPRSSSCSVARGQICLAIRHGPPHWPGQPGEVMRILLHY